MKNKIKSLLLVLAFGMHSIQHAPFYDSYYDYRGESLDYDLDNASTDDDDYIDITDILATDDLDELGDSNVQQNTTTSIDTTPQVAESSLDYYTNESAPTDAADLFGVSTKEQTVSEQIADWLDGIKKALDASLEQTANDFNTSLANTRQSLEILSQAFIDAFVSLGEAIQLSNAKIKADFEEMLKTNDAALNQIKQDLIDFGKGVDKEIQTLNGIAQVMGAGKTAGNFILDMFNDIANMVNNTANVNYMKNNTSYAVYKTAITAGKALSEIEAALDQAGSEIVTTTDYVQKWVRDLGITLGK